MAVKVDEIIMYDSPEAAYEKTVTGWVSKDGYFFGNDENLARYRGCTHKMCDCGEIMEKHYTKCKKCRDKSEQERYYKLEFSEWDGQLPLFIYGSDEIFYDEAQIEDYCEIHDLYPINLNLVLAQENRLKIIDLEIWSDELPENVLIPRQLLKKVNKLNEFIGTLPPISYSPSKYRTNLL